MRERPPAWFRGFVQTNFEFRFSCFGLFSFRIRERSEHNAVSRFVRSEFRVSIFVFRLVWTFKRSNVPTLRSHQESMRAVELDDIEAVLGVDFVLHAVDVVLYGLFGEREVVGDFFVGEALSEEGNQLLFAAREAKALASAAAGERRSFILEIAEQRDAKRAR